MPRRIQTMIGGEFCCRTRTRHAMTSQDSLDRCRIVLVVPPEPALDDLLRRLDAALGAGDVASLIVPAIDGDPAESQRRAEAIVGLAHTRGVAVVLADELRVAMPAGADGVHVDGGREALADLVDRAQSRVMVGAGGAKTRHDALELGELQPDYLFFGRFGHDLKPDAHPRNLSLGQWWSEMTQIPCIVQAGSDLASVDAVAATGADFVALGAAIFGDGVDPAQGVAEANRMLERHAAVMEDQQ
jgi:thiamine-phosphate pyrophosphorylase